MAITNILVRVVAFLLCAETMAAFTFAQGPTPPPNNAPVTRLGRMDPQHPLHIGPNYYPKEALKHREQGRCVISFLILADGSVPASQLTISSGFPNLDIACIESVIDVPMLPRMINGTPVPSWSAFPITWQLSPPQLIEHPPVQKFASATVSPDYELHVGAKYYPEEARAKHERGYCVIHTIVDPMGTVSDARITHSTGSKLLDKACVDAIIPARFSPVVLNGVPVEDPTDIAIYW